MASILGLHWERNFFAETGERSYTLVANEGPLVSDFHYYAYDSGDYLLHVGSLNRFTFFGDPDQEITAEFVDCRKGSPSLHQLVRLDFTPDPRKVLHIAQGIAMKFSGMRNILVRSEPVWFAPSSATTNYNVGNDQTYVPAETPASHFPKVSVNDLPLPPEALQIILKRQQEILRNGDSYDTAFDVAVNGEISRFASRRNQ
ncbi:hypothetical protein AB0L83_32040 [Streptomyces sp. NPDC052071]|uniref:hypothetical protein n=1 Tax=Streptomyces sp. NPDC052071 TaxID=3156666 RepID=UPI00342E9A8D